MRNPSFRHLTAAAALAAGIVCASAPAADARVHVFVGFGGPLIVGAPYAYPVPAYYPAYYPAPYPYPYAYAPAYYYPPPPPLPYNPYYAPYGAR